MTIQTPDQPVVAVLVARVYLWSRLGYNNGLFEGRRTPKRSEPIDGQRAG